MTNIRNLLRLQDIDQERSAIQSSLAELRSRQGESERLKEARSTVASATERMVQVREALKEREIEFDRVSRKLAASQTRLYSGKVSNPKELQGLEEEVKYLTERADQFQEVILESLIEVEDGQAALQGDEAVLRDVRSEWESEQSLIEQEMQQLEERFTSRDRDRESLLAKLPAADLELYEDLRRRKGPAPIARMVNSACEGCGVSLPVAQARRVLGGGELISCSSCGRLLVAK